MRSANSTLTSLDVSNNPMSLAACKSINLETVLCQLRNPAVTAIDARGKGFDDEDTTKIGKCLRSNSYLATLDLGDNQIGAAGATCLANALLFNSSLVILNLGSNEHGAAGATSLAEALRVNTTLTKLDLTLKSNLNVGSEGEAALRSALEINTSMTKCLIGKYPGTNLVSRRKVASSVGVVVDSATGTTEFGTA